MALLFAAYPQDGRSAVIFPTRGQPEPRADDRVRRPRRLGVSGHRRDEVVALELEQLDVRLRDDVGGARNVSEQRDLAEEVAGAELARLRVHGRDLDGAVDDHVEAVAVLPGAEDRLACRNPALRHLLREVLERRRRQAARTAARG